MRRNKRYMWLMLLLLLTIFITISGYKVTSNENKIMGDGQDAEIITNSIPNEFLQVELNYIGSAKVKRSDVFMWDTEACATYPDALSRKEYTYSYRLFSSKEGKHSVIERLPFTVVKGIISIKASV